MPYILAADRDKLKPATDAIASVITKDTVAGDLNYMITLMAKAYIDAKGLRYEHLNAVVGGVVVLTEANSAIVQFPGGYIAEIHAGSAGK